MPRCSARIAPEKHLLEPRHVAANPPLPNSSLSLAQSPSMPRCLQVVFENGVNRTNAILPGYLLSFRISPSVIRDSYFVHSAAFAGKLGDNFRFYSKTIFFYLNRFNNRRAERFVARFHICEIDVGEHIGEQGQKFIAYHVPEKKDAMRSSTHEPGTKNGIRLT